MDLKSIAKLHQSKLEKWYTTVTRIRHFNMLRQLTQRLRQNAYFLNGIRRRVRKAIDDNWSYGDCGWRLTRKTYYKNCRCHLCEDWDGCGSTKTTKCFSYFCEVCNTEKALPKHLKRSYNETYLLRGNVYHTYVKMIKYYGQILCAGIKLFECNI